VETPKIFDSELRFCEILWSHEPIKSSELVRLCAEELGWKKSTTYTVIKRLAERGVEVEMKLYGGDGLVFIGNSACGVTDLTLDQVRAIFRGEITNWSELGGADHAIRVLYRDDQSGSQRLFEKMVFKGEDVPDYEALGFERLDEMNTLVSACLDNPYAIGYSIMTYLNDVYSNEALLAFSLNGYSATPENVRTGDYPLGTKGYVVIRSDEPEDSPARRLYNWFGSPLSDTFLTSCGITPLSE
jgi:phosphate transport system substrate-binding protein